MASSSLVVSNVLILLLVVVTVTEATLVHSSCPRPGSQTTFDLNRYLGKWYEYERFSAWFQTGVVCGSAEYGLNDDGSISVKNGGRSVVKIFGHTIPTSITGKATVPDSSKPAELRVSFSPVDSGSGPANYFIVDTDYTSYTVVYQCRDLPGPFNLSIQYAWIMTRERGVAPSNLADLKSNLESHGVDLSNFISVDQSDCEGY